MKDEKELEQEKDERIEEGKRRLDEARKRIAPFSRKKNAAVRSIKIGGWTDARAITRQAFSNVLKKGTSQS